MRRSRLLVPLLALATMSLGAVAPAVTHASSPPVAEKTKLPKNLTPVEEIPAQAAGAEIAAVAAKHPAVYGGTEWDSEKKVLYVNLAAPTRKQLDTRTSFRNAIASKLAAKRSPVRIEYRSARFSVQGAQKLLDTFMDTRATWGGASAKKHVVAASVDEVTGRLSAQATGDVAAIQAAARKTFGANVAVRMGRGVTPTDRFGDSAPWTAGNAIWFDQYERGLADCTQGYNWRRWSDNLRYASTAGHCMPSNTSVFHTSITQRIGYIGTVYLNTNEYIDFSYIRITSGSVDNTVWVGPRATNELRRVVSAQNDDTTKGTVCSSGANGGLRCGTIIDRDFEAEMDTHKGKVYLDRLTCVKPSTAYGYVVAGDSGGPWLTTASNGDVKAWGQTVGYSDCDGDGVTDSVFSTVKNIATRAGASLIVS